MSLGILTRMAADWSGLRFCGARVGAGLDARSVFDVVRLLVAVAVAMPTTVVASLPDYQE